jgi:UDP-N-acetylglucosamine 2-epimerase (non-hydrolysing)
MKLLYVVGARPNFVKLAPVYHTIEDRFPHIRQVLVHTGQHYDREMSEIFIDELELPPPHHFLGVGPGSHGEQTARALERVEQVLLVEKPDIVIVGGDVNSTLAAALGAAKLEIPIAHVEAGLRSFDRSMPEEVNRVVTDQLSRWCFTHSPEAEPNLLREGVPPQNIHFVGNTMIDTLVRLRRRIGASDVHARLGVEPGQYMLVTLHRPKLVDGELLAPVVRALDRIGQALPVVFPVHPRTRGRIHALGIAPAIELVPPLGYLDFLALETHAKAVLTDSGGVQEETTFLGVPCFTLRANTERPVTVELGTNRVLGLDPRSLADIPRLAQQAPRQRTNLPGWDARAAERVATCLAEALEQTEDARLSTEGRAAR